jgi:hypothetical protein
VNQYSGRPTDSQVARAEVLGRELQDVINEFTRLTNEQLPAINRELEKKKLEPIKVITEQEWDKQQGVGPGV